MRIDILLATAAFVAAPALLVPALRAQRGGAGLGAGAWPARAFSVEILPDGAVPDCPEGPFAPTLAPPSGAAAAGPGAIPDPPAAPPPEADAPPRLPPLKPSQRANQASPSETLAALASGWSALRPSPGAFASPSALPELPPPAGADADAVAFVFRSAPGALPAIVVDAPSLPPERVARVERALASSRAGLSATGPVERVSLRSAQFADDGVTEQ